MREKAKLVELGRELYRLGVEVETARTRLRNWWKRARLTIPTKWPPPRCSYNSYRRSGQKKRRHICNCATVSLRPMTK